MIFDQILYELLSGDPPKATLAGLGDEAAVLMLGRDLAVALLHPQPDTLTETLTRLSEALGQRAALLLVAGGPASLGSSMEALASELPGRAVLAQISDDGLLWSHEPLPESKPLAAALARVQQMPGILPAPAEEIAALIQKRWAESRAAARDAVHFQERLKSRKPVATMALVASLVLVFGLQMAWGALTDSRQLLAMGANSPELVREGDTWRVLSATFLHGGLLHLLFNTLALWSIGGFLERLLGPWRLLLLFSASAAAGGIASALAAQASLSVGASGGVWGLFLGAGWLAFRGRDLLPAAVSTALKTSTIQTLMLNVFVSFMPNVDMAAHFGGGAAGLLVGLMGGIVPREQGSESATSGVALAGMLGAVLLWGSMILALLHGRPWAS